MVFIETWQEEAAEGANHLFSEGSSKCKFLPLSETILSTSTPWGSTEGNSIFPSTRFQLTVDTHIGDPSPVSAKIFILAE